jgi:hypothetical protein
MRTINLTSSIPGEMLPRLLGINPDRPVVAFMGGASGAQNVGRSPLRRQIMEGLAKAIIELDAVVVDGGSDEGAMRLLNMGLREVGFEGTYIGVAPASLVSVEVKEAEKGLTQIGKHHTHLVLSDGDHWGDEREVMYKIVNTLAAGNPSLGVLANGGSLAQKEVVENVKVKREVIVLEGSGRLADEIAQEINSPESYQDQAIKELVKQGRFTLFNINHSPDDLAAMILEKLRR